MRDYGRFQSGTWTDPRFLELSKDAKLLLLYICTGPHASMIGAARIPDGYVIADLQLSANDTRLAFLELQSAGFIDRCSRHGWVNAAGTMDAIDNPNQATAALRLFRQIPDESAVKQTVAAKIKQLAPKVRGEDLDRFAKPLLQPFDKPLCEPLVQQEQEQEQEQEREQEGCPNPLPPADKSLPVPSDTSEPLVKILGSRLVEMTPSECDDMVEEMGLDVAVEYVDRLDAYCVANGKRYSDWRAAVKSWWLRDGRPAVPPVAKGATA